MKILAKNKKLIFSIITALIVFLMAIFAFTFKNNNFEVYADYGELKEDSYYSKDNVIFYAIKVKDGKLLWKADTKIKFTYESEENSVTFDPVNDDAETKENYVNLYKKTDGTIVYKVGGIEKTVTKFLDPNKEETEISSSSINFIGILADDLLQPVKYNDTVLLEDGEQILISFGNTTTEYGIPASDPIDFSNVKIIVNGNEDLIDDLQIASTHDETSTKQSLTYVYDLSKKDKETNLIYVNEEGLVEFSADYEHKTANNKFDFKFYVFHKDTYKATQPNEEVRPNARLENVSTVYDQNTKNTFFSESFYYFNNQDWAKIVYNPERYELNISKNVNTFASTYTFTYNNGTIVEEVDKPRTTENIYVSDFYWETNADGSAKLDANGNVALYLKDIGVYDITYKAVYYGSDGSKAELDTLNRDKRTDRLTIYGVQATYNDFEDGQTELREIKNPNESISADVTGNFSFNPEQSGTKYAISTVGLLANEIASTNQPQVRFITNSTEKDFEVYYSENFSSDANFEVTKETGYTINSNFTKPGYYFVIVKNAYENFKNDSGIQSNVERTQYFVFRIKNQSPSISIYKLAEENNNLVYSNTIMSGSFEGGNYVGSFVNKGVLIEQYEENSSFDLPIEFKLERKGFAENDFSQISLGTAITLNNSDESAQKTGYKITEDGHYRLVVNFGSSNIKRYFDIDSQPISGLQTKDVNQVGTNTFAIVGNAQQANVNTLLTSSSFVLNWLDKASGAKITAKYVRYAMNDAVFDADANNYILDGTKVAANSEIKIQQNPSTSYTKPVSESYITANEVLTLPGFYIFTLIDDAGNEATLKIVLDNSLPTILQASEPEIVGQEPDYEIISSLNNTIAAKTRVFFGTHKLVKLNIKNNAYDPSNDTRFVNIDGTYYMQTTLNANVKEQSNKTSKSGISNASQGYDIIELETRDGNVIECTYKYTITDETRKETSYLVTISTDKTGVNVITNDGTQFVNEGTKTTNAIYNNNEEETSSSKRITYYNFVDSDVVYLIYKTLTPDGINAKIDLTQNGLTIEYYALVYNSTKGCYEYSNNPSQTIVITEDIANNAEYNEIVGSETIFKYPINVDSFGKTLPGKYVVKRNYTIDNTVGETRTISQIVENDFVEREYVFFVDRNPIISAPTSAENQRFGAYSYITLFDGQNEEIKYESLYNQNQNNLRAVLLTNKLPIGIYIPTNKYGYVSDEIFTNAVSFENLDADINGNPTNFYPYVLTVYVVVPNGQKYEYSRVANSNYYVLENNSAIINNSEWAGGDYTLTITCGTTTKQNATDVPTQTFNFIYKVSDLAPEINIQGQYVGLNMISSQQIAEDKDEGVYYSNADIINISFQDPSTDYLTKIGKISYRFASGAWQDLDISSKNASINVKELAPNATQLQIKVEYEVYCKEGNEDLQALYPNGNWQVIKTIKFNKTAPLQVLTALKNADLIVNNISFDQFREIEERYNLTIAEGIYKQYSFAIAKTNLDAILASANELYLKKIEDKYPDAVEIQSPFKAGVAAGNVFNKELATTTLGYSKYVANNTEFDINSYYEFVEYDKFGNTSIYTVFVLPSDDSITLKTSAGEFSPTETEILARRNFYFESIGAKNTLNQINNAKYQYIKLSMNGQTYLLTPFTGAANAYNITVQSETSEQIELKSVVLNPGRYTISLIENNTQHNIVLRIGANDEKLKYSYFNENGEVGIIVGESSVIELRSLTITVINSNGTTDPYEYIKGEESNTITNVDNKYYISRNGNNWNNSIFLIQITDNFGEKYSILKSYTQTQFNRYETAEQKSDITPEMQTSSNILVSHNVLFNFSNLYKAKVERRSFNATQFVNANLGDPETKMGYYQLELTKNLAQNDLFDGGVIFYKITLSANIPNQNEIDVDIEDEEFYITIFNQLPKLTIRDSAGVDITNELYEKTRTQSDEVYLNFEAENEISQSLGCTSKVYLRLRGASEGYVEIPNEYVVSEPGTYDVLIQNECDGKVFANSETHSFVISSHDVMFYSVINTETDEIVNPTGTSYDYDGEIINYYYILNTDSYTIATKNSDVKCVQDGYDLNGAIITKIYKITAGTNFSRNIAITVIPKNDNIINDFGYFVGDNSGVVGIQNINTPELDVYLYKTNTEDSITLRWNYYYGIEANVISYEITRGSGSDAVTIKGESYNKSSGFMEYTLDKSGIYTIKFKDLAGNVQVLTTNKGTFDSYKINFIKSVIFEINEELPIDNAIYNEPVTISIPASTKSYYPNPTTIVATKNGKEVLLTQNKDGKYVATEQGEYVVYFTTYFTTTSNDRTNIKYLKNEPIKFTIINANESRWAFNYHNYNGYQIEAKYNNEEFDLSNVLDGGEIVMSVILGNESLDNGIYSFNMTTEEGLNFAFNIWLNNTKPDILVSHEEGTKTTEHIIVRYNTENLFDSVGDCVVKINNKVVSTINSEYFETANYDKTVLVELTEVSPYLIQVYTANDKLIYSYKVEITAPLNAISIILISVGAGVAVTGIILFILLRKKLKIR